MSKVGKKVSIEIGHGGTDPGAVRGNIREKDINLVVGLELKQQLERHGVNVLVNRTTDVGFRVADFLARAKTFNPDVGLSVHTNAFNGNARGFEVFRNTNAFKTPSNLLCANIEKQVKKLGQSSRGVKDSPFMMSSLSCPTAYLELGFLDNPDVYKQFNTSAKQRAFAEAYAKGVLEYFGIAWKKEGSAPTPAAAPAAVSAPVVSAPAAQSSKVIFRVVAGSFSSKANALARANALKSKGFDAFIAEHKN